MIAGIIGFTYTFVNALPAAEVPAPTTTIAGGTTTTAATATTTTTLPPANAALVAAADGFSTRAGELVVTAQQLNDEWDERVIEFADIRDGLTELRSTTGSLVDEVSELEVPDEATEAWGDVVTAAEALTAAADEMFDGLVNSEGSERRLNALDAYKAAEVSLQDALTLAVAATQG